MDEMKAAVVSHLDRTISIGSHATGKSIIERV
jgi:butyrate kinase